MAKASGFVELKLEHIGKDRFVEIKPAPRWEPFHLPPAARFKPDLDAEYSDFPPSAARFSLSMTATACFWLLIFGPDLLPLWRSPDFHFPITSFQGISESSLDQSVSA